jgi:hypothetical protein
MKRPERGGKRRKGAKKIDEKKVIILTVFK